MSYEFTLEEYKNLDNYLLYELGMSGVLSVPTVKKIKARNDILKEELSFDDIPVILQEEDGERKKRDRPNLTVDWDNVSKGIIIGHGISHPETMTVPVEKIRQSWEDLSLRSAKEFLASIGYTTYEIGERDEGGNLNNHANKIAKEYNERYAQFTPSVTELPTWGHRKADYGSSQARRDRKEEEANPTMDDVHGKGTRNSRVVDSVNKTEILDGVFYRDYTKISRSRLSKWVRFWRSDVDKVTPNKKNLLGKLVGRTWSKTFLLGYRTDRTMFHEIWYNSMDSSFSVYDMNGVEKTDPVPTLQEAMRGLIRIIAQEAPDDDKQFRSSGAGQDLARSLNNAFSKELLPTAKELAREDELLTRELARERKEKESKEAQKQADQAKKDRDIAARTIKKGAARNFVDGSSSVARSVSQKVSTASKEASASASAASKAASEKAAASSQKAYSDASSAITAMDAKKRKKQAEEQGRILAPFDPDNKGDNVTQQDANNKRQAQELAKSIKRSREALSGDVEKLNTLAEKPDALGELGLSPYFRDLFNAMEGDDLAERASKTSVYLQQYLRNMDKVSIEGIENLEQIRKFMDDSTTITDVTDLTQTRKHAEEVKKKVRENSPKPSKKASKSDLGPMTDDMFAEKEPRRGQADLFSESIERELEALNEQEEYSGRFAAANAQRRSVQDQLDADQEFQALEAREKERLMSDAADRHAKKVREDARNSPHSKQMLIQDISDSIEAYDITRVPRRSAFRKFFDKFAWTRGRSASVDTPLSGQSFFSKAKQAFIGRGYRADFIRGYSLGGGDGVSQGGLNIEIWYVTEKDKGSDRFISSFYIYDVASERFIRTSIPYFRTAISIVSAKLGLTGSGL